MAVHVGRAATEAAQVEELLKSWKAFLVSGQWNFCASSIGNTGMTLRAQNEQLQRNEALRLKVVEKRVRHTWRLWTRHSQRCWNISLMNSNLPRRIGAMWWGGFSLRQETNTCTNVSCLWAVKKWRRNSRLTPWMEIYNFFAKTSSETFITVFSMTSIFNAKTTFVTFNAVLSSRDEDDVNATSPKRHQWHTSQILYTRKAQNIVTFLVTKGRWWHCKGVS